MRDAAAEPMTVTEFMAWDDGTDTRRELIDGRVLKSTPQSASHVLVSSEQRHVVIWRRRGRRWEVEDLIGDAARELESVAVPVPLAAIYADSGV